MNTETKNFESERKILDSGNRRQFETGAVRDIAEGKGRCDLLPLDIIADYFIYGSEKVYLDKSKYAPIASILFDIDDFVRRGDVTHIYNAINHFINYNKYTSTIGAVLEIAKHYEQGAKKYAERNWEKGIPAHCYVDSGVRHLLKIVDDWTDEPHDRAFLWNMFCLVWTVKHMPWLNDLPYMQEQYKDKKLRRDIIEATECSNEIQKAMEEAKNGKRE